MARHKTPSNILDAKGAFKKNPNRRPQNEPQPGTPFPKEPPKHLDKSQKACWQEIVSICPDGVLTGSDVLIVEVVAILLDRFRHDPDAMGPAHIKAFTSELGKLGLSPSDRTKIQVLIPKGNKFDEF